MNKEIADIFDESLTIALSEMVISTEEYNLAKDYINRLYQFKTNQPVL